MMSTNQPAKLTVLILLALLSFHGCSKIRCLTLPENSTDVLSLLAFKAANDPTGVLSSWNSSTNHCTWKGVNCSLTHPGRVTALELPGNNLAGSISSSLGNLTFLRTLDLSANRLSGELPPVRHLHKLEILNLSSNVLQGSIPVSLTNCSNLRILHLSRNSLVGEIPPGIGLLNNLSVLQLSKNNLTGIIPPTLSNTTSLVTLDLTENNLIGNIPHGFGKLRNMSWLSLGQNKLSGAIPLDLFSLTSLEGLSLETNMLTGTLPSDIGDTLSNIVKISVGGNMLEGPIPPSLGNASRLYLIDLSHNNFSGGIPSSLGKLSLLKQLNLEANNLEARDSHSWEFMNTLANCRFLEMLSVYNNKLQGVIPNSIGNLSIGLQELYLGINNLSGNVPPNIGNLRQLTILELNENNLSGTVEGWIGNLTQLQLLVLHQNNFFGQITSVFGLTQLVVLDLSSNEFEGPIPSSIGSLEQLFQLDLSYNKLYGNIPIEISSLQQLVQLFLSSNKLSGEIPDVLGQCNSLSIVEMSQNKFTGNIPKSFGNLQHLTTLNLSHNSLSGIIPTALDEELSLTMLDLSYNHLQGEIPITGIFENATAVSLNGNLGLCGGPMELHMPSCSPIISHRVDRRNYLIKILIPIFGFMSLVVLVYFLFLEKKMSRKNHQSLNPFGDHFIKVSYADLAQATRDFSESNLIGRGSYGTVYRGRLKETKVEVAVKVFNLEMRGADKSFFSECEALRSIQHRNLLPIITACSTADSRGDVFKALLYEFMPNGSLDTWLHNHGDRKDSKRLGLTLIISVAVNIADALDYLHHDCGRPTVHCDVKPSNILLDDDMNALLGDFGIARFYLDSQLISQGSTTSTGMKGTIGYIAPEYAGGGHASASGDVYSFGIVLLEMMTCKRPTDPMFKIGIDIVNFVRSNFPHQILRIVDAHITEECKDYEAHMASENMVYQCLVSLLQIALSCARPLPSERMDMKQVANKLHIIKKSYLEWKAKK